MMQRFILGLAAAAFALTGLVTLALPAQAASLTSAQIQSVIGLLQSFGVASTTIMQVQSALTGSAVVSVSTAPAVGTVCPTLSEDFGRGYSDKHSRGDAVSALQRFLEKARADYSAGVTGYFGPETEGAVKAWQAAHGVPATGFVGPLTRAAIAHACNSSHRDDAVPSAYHSSISLFAQPTIGEAPLPVRFSTSGASSTQQYILTYGDGSISGAFSGSSTIMHTYAKAGDYTATLSPYVACMYSTPRCEIAVMMLAQAHVIVTGTSSATSTVATTTPKIISVQPTVGAIGTQVTIGGNGFTGDNTVFFNGGVVAKSVAAKPAIFNCPMTPAGSTTTACGSYAQTLTFGVPGSMGPYCPAGQFCPLYLLRVTPGAYALSVQNENGASATSTFTVASSSAQE